MMPDRTVPTHLHISSTLWVCAVLAGVAESVLGVIGAVRADAPPGMLRGMIGARTVIYGLLIFTALRLGAGKRWPRPVLAVGLGVIGLATLVVGPAQSVLAGTAPAIGEYLASASAMDLGFALIRTCHVLLVLTAVAMMFTPTANGFFRRRILHHSPLQS